MIYYVQQDVGWNGFQIKLRRSVSFLIKFKTSPAPFILWALVSKHGFLTVVVGLYGEVLSVHIVLHHWEDYLNFERADNPWVYFVHTPQG